MDSKRVLEVLQSLNVDVKNHMSTIDQKTAEKVTEAVRHAEPQGGEGAANPAAKPAKPAVQSKPTRDANPAKTSLLEDFFGSGTRPQRPLVEKRERRPLMERRAPAERPAAELRPGALKPAAPARPAAEVPPAQRPAEKAQPAAAAPGPERARAEAKPGQPERAGQAAAATGSAAPQKPAATPAPAEQKPAASSEPAAAAAPAKAARTDAAAPADQAAKRQAPAPERREEPPAGAAQPSAGRPAAEAAQPQRVAGAPAKPAAAAKSGIGLPTKPAEKPAEQARPAGSGIGLPVKPAAGQAGARSGGGLGLPQKPRGGAARSGGGLGMPQRPGRRSAPLAIPKLDPKVAEQAKSSEGKPRFGKGEKRSIDDLYDRREEAASQPAEEKLFAQRQKRKAAAQERRVLKPITISGPMTVKDLAHEMGVTAAEVIKTLLTGFGIMATINQELDVDTCVLVASEFGVEATVEQKEDITEIYDRVEDPDEPEELKKPRPPVVTIMGHVDHGKTSLLDAIRQTKVAAAEAGGITQHIGAYEVEVNGKKITFLDTPGHEAFTAMRARGANATDIAVLVVAADDSVMPQTVESINHAKAANVPILVAINKIDKPEANPQRVMQDLTQYDLVPEQWGGDTIMVPVSAKEKTNLDLLLENILVLAEVSDLKANPDKPAAGTILEAALDKSRGPVATVLVQAGTLNVGDVFVAGMTWGRVRAMFDHRGRRLKSAGPSTPVRVLGFNAVPQAGDVFRVTPDEKTARAVAEKRIAQAQAQRQAQKAISLDDFMSQVAQGEIQELNVIVKADVQGSVEAIRGQLEKLRNEEVKVRVIHAGVGAISESDVMLAVASKAIIIGFNVRPDDRASRAAEEHGIDVRTYSVIYDIVDDIEAAMKGMLKPKIQEVILGKAEVRETFKVPKVGVAAGCMVIQGKVTRNARYRLIRDGVVVWDGEINELRRYKDEVKEVPEGYECGITLVNFHDFKRGDILEAYELQEIKAG